MRLLRIPEQSAWLRVAKPAGLLLLVPLLLSPQETQTPERESESIRPAVSTPGVSMSGSHGESTRGTDHEVAKTPGTPEPAYAKERRRMVRDQIEARGVDDPQVLSAMRRVPRHRFVPAGLASASYQDRPLRIGFGQTISQPYIVAAMSELAKLEPGAKVLEVGTGSGYQAAVIHEIAGEVFSLEIVGELAESARKTLTELGYDKAHIRHANGYLGWPEEAPFDAILVTAAPPEVPRALLEQLVEGGRLVLPVGSGMQMLEVHTRHGQRFTSESVFPVRFVPMVQRAREGTGVAEATP